ncbi:unnamed protein product [Discosporangium mesarthrocarpum]
MKTCVGLSFFSDGSSSFLPRLPIKSALMFKLHFRDLDNHFLWSGRKSVDYIQVSTFKSRYTTTKNPNEK